jgi:hypothetical protein
MQTWDDYSDPDSEPTLKVYMPNFLPKVMVEGPHMEEDDIPTKVQPRPIYPFPKEKTDPRMGLLIILAFVGSFWGTVTYLLW